MTTIARQIDALKADSKFFEAGQLARANGHDRSYGCHLGFRSTLERDRSEFYRGYDAEPVPTTEQVQTYIAAYYERNYTTKHVGVGTIRPSTEDNEGAVDCKVYVAFTDGTSEVHDWTLWIEGGKVYGEW